MKNYRCVSDGPRAHRLFMRVATVVLTLLALLAANLAVLGEAWGQIPGELTGDARSVPPVASPGASSSEMARQQRWTIGSSFGFLGRTPDHTAFAWNTTADYFLQREISIGPLLQMAFTSDMAQVGLSGQVKYWLPSQINSHTSLNVQSGVGFVYADAGGSDASWLIPMGLGLDYALSPTATLTSAFLLNFTNLDLGRGADAHVMPGFTIGLRF